jgi:hypothetical protein
MIRLGSSGVGDPREAGWKLPCFHKVRKRRFEVLAQALLYVLEDRLRNLFSRIFIASF